MAKVSDAKLLLGVQLTRGYKMEVIDLAQQMKVHKWRMRFAFFPVKRIKMVKGYIEHDGYYLWRIVFEIECGLVTIWTAYAHMNDGVKYSNS